MSRRTRNGSASKSKSGTRAKSRKRGLKAATASAEGIADYGTSGSASAPWFGVAGRGTLLVKAVLGILLAPLCLITSWTLIEAAYEVAIEGRFWAAQSVWAFGAGMLLWGMSILLLPRPTGFYVWGHELTHVVFTYLSGGRVTNFEANSEGGYVHTTKTNTLISLSPYLVPLYSIAIILVAYMLNPFVDWYHLHKGFFFELAGLKLIWVVLGLIGYTWAFHLTFTIWMIRREQPDLQENGVFFSVVLIYFANILAVCLFLIIGSEDMGMGKFGQLWRDNFDWVVNGMRNAVGSLGAASP